MSAANERERRAAMYAERAERERRLAAATGSLAHAAAAKRAQACADNYGAQLGLDGSSVPVPRPQDDAATADQLALGDLDVPVMHVLESGQRIQQEALTHTNREA